MASSPSPMTSSSPSSRSPCRSAPVAGLGGLRGRHRFKPLGVSSGRLRPRARRRQRRHRTKVAARQPRVRRRPERHRPPAAHPSVKAYQRMAWLWRRHLLHAARAGDARAQQLGAHFLEQLVNRVPLHHAFDDAKLKPACAPPPPLPPLAPPRSGSVQSKGRPFSRREIRATRPTCSCRAAVRPTTTTTARGPTRRSSTCRRGCSPSWMGRATRSPVPIYRIRGLRYRQMSPWAYKCNSRAYATWRMSYLAQHSHATHGRSS